MKITFPLDVSLSPTASANLRRELDGGYQLFVPPSSASTPAKQAAENAVNLQRAVDQVQATVPEYFGLGTVILRGQYFWGDSTITLGVAGGADARVCLAGSGSAVIRRIGPRSSKYVISAFGTGHGSKPLLSNLTLLCDHLCRGILLARADTQTTLDNLYVRDSAESSLDLVNCWWLHPRAVYVAGAWGFGMRTHNCNGCHYDSVQFLQCEGKEGYWPASDDMVCTNEAGSPWRTSDAERSMIFHDGNGTTFTNLGLEGCDYGDYPLVYLSRDAMGNRFLGMRQEANRNLRETVLCTGRYNCFDGVFSCNSNESASLADCFLRLTGTTRGNSVHRFVGWSGIKEGGRIVLLDGGKHVGTSVTECATADAHIPQSDWIGEVNNPIVQAEWDDQFDSVN